MVRAAESSGLAAYAWQVQLLGEMASLGPAGERRFVDVATPGTGFVPVTRLLEPPHLSELIRRAGGLDRDNADGAAIPDMDATIAVSRFARQYCGAVSAAASVGLAHGIGIDMSPERCRVALTNIELPVTRRRFVATVDLTGAEVLRCAQRPTSLPVTGPVVPTIDELREYVWSRLFGAHYAELFRRVREVAPTVSPALLWTSAAEYVGAISDAAQEHLSAIAAAPYVADRRALLDGETLPGVGGPNPLRGRLVWDSAGPEWPRAVQTRQLCCLNYLLAERDGMLCQNCPHLPPADRAALAKERRDMPIGSAEGSAHRRAREMGQRRPSYQRRQRPAEADQEQRRG